MSLQDLLPLDESHIDTVTTVVHQWCKFHRVAIDSGRGRVAMTTAVRLAIGGKHSSPALAEALGRSMRIKQFQRPVD
ncbi:hypothetical protein SAMN02927900_04231 [Rhizobium mongolense subsp. loessense]|uniref:Uncharacterized protein n=1 Tax=Rhizobium mongolense subsp. loessense TaxID=158890 RepID=A0A1G4SXE1_9HYPH|nr:hypothetical protein SAMN02927900_04231 [Rhizobium mongolense subsp. loessense]